MTTQLPAPRLDCVYIPRNGFGSPVRVKDSDATSVRFVFCDYGSATTTQCALSNFHARYTPKESR